MYKLLLFRNEPVIQWNFQRLEWVWIWVDIKQPILYPEHFQRYIVNMVAQYFDYQDIILENQIDKQLNQLNNG